jgi:hypothetical protein
MKVRSVGVRRVWDCMLCACVSEEGEDGEGADSETPSLLSYILRILRYVSLAELGTLCRVGLRDPMHLCTCVSKEGGEREGAELCRVGLRDPMHLCTCVSEEGADGEGAEQKCHLKN